MVFLLNGQHSPRNASRIFVAGHWCIKNCWSHTCDGQSVASVNSDVGGVSGHCSHFSPFAGGEPAQSGTRVWLQLRKQTLDSSLSTCFRVKRLRSCFSLDILSEELVSCRCLVLTLLQHSCSASNPADGCALWTSLIRPSLSRQSQKQVAFAMEANDFQVSTPSSLNTRRPQLVTMGASVGGKKERSMLFTASFMKWTVRQDHPTGDPTAQNQWEAGSADV